MKSADAIVFVVDDNPSVRKALGNLISSVGMDVEVFSSAREFLQHKRPERPACLVLDVRLPGLSGLDLQKELAGRKIDLPIIFITGHGDIPMSVRAMKAGAVEFLPKPFREQDLLDAIRLAVENNRLSLEQQAELAALKSRYDRLTPREREVMARVVAGLLNKQIADELGTSEITVKTQRGQAMKKMQAKSLADLVRLAERLKISSTQG